MNKKYRFEELEQQRIDFASLHNLLWVANTENRHSGFVLKTTTYSDEELKEYLGKEGKCFVAFLLDQIVGTLGIRFTYKYKWYINGMVAEYCLAGVLPEYRGEHILGTLSEMAFQFASLKCTSMILSTAEKNKNAISIYEHFGFIPVDFIANLGGDHYSIIMMKWFGECPFNKLYMKYRYSIKKAYVKIRYLPSKKKRFGI